VLDSKLQTLKDHFGISTVNDWRDVRPEWVVALDGIGPKTLAYLRLLLAGHGLTLKGDRTPEYWKQHADDARIVDVLGNELIDDDDGNPAARDRGIVLPFTVLIDSAEQSPFTFQGLRSDAADGGRPLIVPYEFTSLGRHPDSFGDYSLDSPIGGRGHCHVERKSMEDAHSTILGWAKKGEDIGRRDRFEKELERLSEIAAALVVVECSFTTLVAKAPQYGQRSAALNAKTIHRSVLAWMQDYKVPWAFCDGRRHAEKATFDWLRRWYTKGVEQRKSEQKAAEKRRAGKQLQQQAVLPMEMPPAPISADIAAL
jgi:hypothetical protein